MDKKLVIKIKNVYGRDMIYPVNETAKKFTELLGQKTLSFLHLKIIKDLGYTIEQDNDLELKGLID